LSQILSDKTIDCGKTCSAVFAFLNIYYRFYFKEVKQVGRKIFHQLGRRILYEKY
jgi:hypothetical protein